jgi:excisionase family DNA binding protein
MSIDDPILTVKQLADRHELSRDIIYKWIRRGGLPTVKAGGYRIRISEFETWWAAKRTTGEGKA